MMHSCPTSVPATRQASGVSRNFWAGNFWPAQDCTRVKNRKTTGTSLGVTLEFNAGFALAGDRRPVRWTDPVFRLATGPFAENVTFLAFRVEHTQHCL